MEVEVTIRPATEEDREAVVNMQGDLWDSEQRFVKPGMDLISREEALENARALFPYSWIFELEGSGSIVGYAIVPILHQRQAYCLMSLYLIPEMRGNGIATMFLDHMKAFMEKENPEYEATAAGVFQDNARAIKLYNKCGYRIIKEG
jgi:ribosomal protein S18 acetylase RimI-like enzyme